MTSALVLNIMFALLVLAAIFGLCLWAIATQDRDRIGRVAERRRGVERRARVRHELPAHAERPRSEDRRYGSTATA